MRAKLLTVVLLTAGLLSPAVNSHAATVESGIGIRLLEAPQARRDDPRARSYIVDHVPPGAKIQRRVEVSNGTSQPADIRIYPGGATLQGGEFMPLPASDADEITAWTSVSPAQVELGPGRATPATVTIAVPADAAPGERYGAIWAEVSSGNSGGVTQVSRVGVRIYLSVASGNEPASDFAIEQLTAQRDEEGTPRVVAQVRNTGGRALDLTGELRLAEGPGGLSGGPFTVDTGVTVAIGETAPVWVTLDDQLPDGPWQATLTLRSGALERSTSAEIIFPEMGEPGNTVPVGTNEPSLPVVPIVIGAAALSVGGLLASRMVRRRHKGV